MPEELHDVQSKTIGDVTVSVAILTDDQAAEHFGVDFSDYDLQALWMSVSNASDRRLWFVRNILDRDFYSPDEVALLAGGDVASSDTDRLHQYLRDESIRVLCLPHTVTEGFVFLPKAQGGRYVDIRLFADVYEQDSMKGERTSSTDEPEGHFRELRFDFAVPLPDGEFDYERLDPERNYADQALPDLTIEELRATLEQLPCCTTDAGGDADGDPLNFVIVGDAWDVLNALSRSGWSFTHRLSLRTILRLIGSAIEGDAYPVAPVSSLYLFGRSQDVALQRARPSIARRNHMRLWMAPFRFEGRTVWIGQVSRDIGIKITTKSPSLTTHIIDPEVDLTREYVLHSLLAEGLVERFGFVKGGAFATRKNPRLNLTGDPYFSDGMRLVVILANEPIQPEQVRSLLWEQSAPPMLEGQSEAAERNVRSIDSPGPASGEKRAQDPQD